MLTPGQSPAPHGTMAQNRLNATAPNQAGQNQAAAQNNQAAQSSGATTGSASQPSADPKKSD